MSVTRIYCRNCDKPLVYCECNTRRTLVVELDAPLVYEELPASAIVSQT